VHRHLKPDNVLLEHGTALLDADESTGRRD
jgi:hypothetical protein